MDFAINNTASMILSNLWICLSLLMHAGHICLRKFHSRPFGAEISCTSSRPKAGQQGAAESVGFLPQEARNQLFHSVPAGAKRVTMSEEGAGRTHK